MDGEWVNGRRFKPGIQARVVVGVAATNRIGLRAMSLTINAHAANLY